MPVVMYMEWEGVTPAQYNETRAKVAWETNVPQGAILHIPCFTDTGIRVVDIWESEGDFDAFVQQRLMPAVAVLGIRGEPRVDIRPLHEHAFAPSIEKATRRLTTA